MLALLPGRKYCRDLSSRCPILHPPNVVTLAHRCLSLLPLYPLRDADHLYHRGLKIHSLAYSHTRISVLIPARNEAWRISAPVSSVVTQQCRLLFQCRRDDHSATTSAIIAEGQPRYNRPDKELQADLFANGESQNPAPRLHTNWPSGQNSHGQQLVVTTGHADAVTFTYGRIL